MIISNTKYYPQEGFIGFRNRWAAMLWFIAMAVFGLAGCNGGGGSEGGDSGSGAPALAVSTLSATGPVAADPADQSGDLLLSRLSVTLASDATVEQLNAAMAEVGATGISYSSPGSPYLTLSVPRQSDGAALVKLAETLRSMPGILFAAPGRQMSALILPGQASGGSPQSPDQLQHLLPSRFPAAWNAVFAENGQPRMPLAQCSLFSEATVIIADFFQSRPSDPSNQLLLFDLAQPFGAFQPGPNDHGWQVAATLANAFDEFLPTGTTPLPECLDFVLVDISGLTYAEIIAQLQQAIAARPSSSRLIANLSFGFGKKFCGPNMDLLCTPENLAISPIGHLQWEIESRILAAIQWAEFDNNALDERLLLVQAAGNENASLPENGGLGNLYRGIRQATLVSPVALATQLGSLDPLFSPSSEAAADLWTSELQPSLLLNDTSFLHVQNLFLRRVSRIPGMANLLLVGSSTRPESGLPGDIVESQFSNEGSMLLAVGEEVVGLGGTLLDGTSYAAPQVAGLAAYLWSISDLEDRPASETAMLIRITTTNTSLLDAYAATLSLDTLSTIGTVGIREALMDVDGNGVFDEQDLQKFATAYGLDDPNTPTIPESRDYSRFDLNGDGATGGIPTAVFDLDRGAVLGGQAPMINAVDRQIEGYTVSFNEAVLSDIQILCYYAYSTLYADGSPTPAQEAYRTDVLGPDRCVLAKMYTNFPGQISDSASLTVSIEVPASGGQYAPAPNMLVSFTPSCGSVSPASGRTDAGGNVTTTVTPTGCTSSVSVTATARAEEGAAPLAQQTVTATVGTIVFGDDITLCRQSMIQAFNASGISNVVGNLSVRLRGSCNEDDEGPVLETALNVSLPGLVRVGGHFDISGQVTGISLPGLTEVGGNFTLSGITGSASPSFSAFRRVTGSFNVSNTTGLSNANFPVLEYVGNSLFVTANAGMTNVSFPLLAQVFTGFLNRGGIFIDGNPNMTQLKIGPAVITTSSGGLFITDNAVLSSLANVSCDISGGGVWITDNPSLPEAEVERFTQCVQE